MYAFVELRSYSSALLEQMKLLGLRFISICTFKVFESGLFTSVDSVTSSAQMSEYTCDLINSRYRYGSIIDWHATVSPPRYFSSTCDFPPSKQLKRGQQDHYNTFNQFLRLSPPVGKIWKYAACCMQSRLLPVKSCNVKERKHQVRPKWRCSHISEYGHCFWVCSWWPSIWQQETEAIMVSYGYVCCL